MRKSALALALGLFAPLLAQGAAASPSFTVLPTGPTWNDLSADGTTVVGTGSFFLGPIPVRWRASDPGVVETYPLDPDQEVIGNGNAVSADGTIVGGNMQISPAQDEVIPSRCSSRFSCIPTLSEFSGFDTKGAIFDLSSDGSFAVGDSFHFADLGLHFGATYWGPTGAPIRMVPYLPSEVGDAITMSRGTAVSGDGSVAAGWTRVPSTDPFAPTQAFVWTPDGGFSLLGDLAGGSAESRPEDVSNDGSRIVGGAIGALGLEAVYWTAGGAVVSLGDLAGGSYGSVANAVSANGSVIVGSGLTAAGAAAFIWDPVNGMRSLYDVLVASGVADLTGWRLTSALGISDDATTFFGVGINPTGQTRSWVAVIPEPSTAALVGVGAVLLGLRRRPS